MKLVLDTSAFFLEVPFEGELYTTPGVVTELRDLRSRSRFEVLSAQGLSVQEAGSAVIARIDAAAEGSGDSTVISAADRGILSLALELGACLVTDDFAVQNIALSLGIPTRSLLQRKARSRKWHFRCTGCGRVSADPAECPVCGSPMKRTVK